MRIWVQDNMKLEKTSCQQCGKLGGIPKGNSAFICERCATEGVAGECPPASNPGYQVKTDQGVIETIAPETHRITKPRPVKEKPG